MAPGTFVAPACFLAALERLSVFVGALALPHLQRKLKSSNRKPEQNVGKPRFQIENTTGKLRESKEYLKNKCTV